MFSLSTVHQVYMRAVNIQPATYTAIVVNYQTCVFCQKVTRLNYKIFAYSKYYEYVIGISSIGLWSEFQTALAKSYKRGKTEYVCDCFINKGNLRDLIAASGLVSLFKLDSNHLFLSPCDRAIWLMILKSVRVHQALCIISNPSVNSNWSYDFWPLWSVTLTSDPNLFHGAHFCHW